jgi:hypothetical protein
MLRRIFKQIREEIIIFRDLKAIFVRDFLGVCSTFFSLIRGLSNLCISVTLQEGKYSEITDRIHNQSIAS